MIHEYFIDPTLIYKWAKNSRDAKFFLNSIGVGTPRLMSSFPKSKASKIKGDLLRGIPDNMPEVARVRVDELVNAFSEVVIRRNATKDLPSIWYEAAQIQCNHAQPDVVVAAERSSNFSCWITEEDAFEYGSLFDHPDQLSPDRSAEGLTDAVKNLLRYSREIIVVDPYLYKTAGIESIKAFICASKENRVTEQQVTFQLIFDASKSQPSYVVGEISAVSKEHQVNLDVLAVEEKNQGEKLHNRYILTELGGISFGVGTDAGEGYHTEDLFLLNSELYEKRWSQYKNAAAFNVKASAQQQNDK